MGSFAVGMLGVFLASVFWGSNFIVTKKYDMGDGVMFQFAMCTGILLVGVGTLFFSEQYPPVPQQADFPLPDYKVVFSTQGLLGGAVWTCGNVLTVVIVKYLGIGLGLSIWSGTSLVTSFVFSRFTIFGLKVKVLDPVWLGYMGALLAVMSLGVFSFVKTVSKQESVDVTTNTAIVDDVGSEDNSVPLLDYVSEEETADEKDNRYKGVMLAILAGFFYGFQFVPLSIHEQQHPKPEELSSIVHQMRFVFSQFLGIYVASFIAFAIYACYHKNKPKLLAPEAFVPAIVSGMMWAVACIGSMLAVTELGLGIGYPLTTNGAFLVNAGWSIFYFREVKGKKNLRIFAAAGLLNIVSCICLTLAKKD
mmetsp:Transcript_1617/g.2465  ORF Transcript_1617/g.2465 Transcript_1617/m.2465 type:complete len:363 (-) Transcript_1617:1109-2197(-)|eukprot:CAMPEP_0203765130 /NCGR_PEP_ID=MMETSP0098-20131031/18245_1 /ASSEMBLY_ACC=CAM_ASM_000208 /TAXON_ID=96639 /ORGANISM=" , Strain NY0313808BC1" /LENGTH=362 /DNA_ID=CAMNT_0050661355 /DNA_START=597 /DNA_END=1685 /DNA_ORIENTATION=-